MEILKHLHSGITLVNEALTLFTAEKKSLSQFFQPVIIYIDRKNRAVHKEISEMTEKSVCEAIKEVPTTIETFVLAGETALKNPQTGKDQYFYVVKLYFSNAPQGYIYSMPFSLNEKEDTLQFDVLKYAGSDDNCYLPFTTPEGEGSSCNAIKMDPQPPFEYRAAFLIGHVNEDRLWHDTDKMVADMFCKLAFETSRKFELIFEVSKFGLMTQSMQESYDNYAKYLTKEIFSQFPHIKAELQLENKRI